MHFPIEMLMLDPVLGVLQKYGWMKNRININCCMLVLSILIESFQDLIKNMLPNLKLPSLVTRRTAASSLVAFCRHARNSSMLASYLLQALLSNYASLNGGTLSEASIYKIYFLTHWWWYLLFIVCLFILSVHVGIIRPGYFRRDSKWEQIFQYFQGIESSWGLNSQALISEKLLFPIIRDTKIQRPPGCKKSWYCLWNG